MKRNIIISILVIILALVTFGHTGWGDVTLKKVQNWIQGQAMTWTGAQTFSGAVTAGSTVTVAGTLTANGTLDANGSLTADSVVTADRIKANSSEGLYLVDDADGGIFIEDGGEIGIGTTGPDRKLDILDASNPQLRLTQADGTVYADFQMNSSGDLVANVDGVSNQLVLDNGGNIGIGTVAPGEKLEVNGSIKFSTDAGLVNSSGNYSLTLITGYEILFGSDGAFGVKKDGDDNNGHLQIGDFDDGWDYSLIDLNQNVISFHENAANTAAMTLNSTGDLLLGTTTAPSAGGGKALIFGDTGTPPTPGSNTAAIFADDVAGTVHMFATEEGDGTGTQLSSHNSKGDPIHFSYSAKTGKATYINLVKLAEVLEKVTGEKLVYQRDYDKEDPGAARIELEIEAGDTVDTTPRPPLLRGR